MFGDKVAFSGTTALIGAWVGDNDNGGDAGAAYVFDTASSDPTPSELIKFTASDGSDGDNFGYSVGVLGNTAVVGANHDDEKGANSGSAYIFSLTGTGGSQTHKLTLSDGQAGDNFGRTVAIEGSTAVVGALYSATEGENFGAAHVYDVASPTEALLHTLTADDGASMDQFGISVAISEKFILVGADIGDIRGGAAYLFEREPGNQLAKLIADDFFFGDSGDLDRFGFSVDVTDEYAIVAGRTDDNEQGTDAGAAYIYEIGVLSSIPEPTTLVLMTLGIAGISYSRRRSDLK